MNKVKAMKIIDEIFKDFEFIYREVNNVEIVYDKVNNLEIVDRCFLFIMGYHPDIHLSVEMFLTMHFRDEYLDVFAFLYPITINENNKNELMLTLNYLNSNIKSSGRCYIDDNNNITYALRLNYNLLEKLPKYCLEEMEKSVEFYGDILEVLYQVNNFDISYLEGKEIINHIWEIN